MLYFESELETVLHTSLLVQILHTMEYLWSEVRSLIFSNVWTRDKGRWTYLASVSVLHTGSVDVDCGFIA